jgi:hypothetical protein
MPIFQDYVNKIKSKNYFILFLKAGKLGKFI